MRVCKHRTSTSGRWVRQSNTRSAPCEMRSSRAGPRRSVTLDYASSERIYWLLSSRRLHLGPGLWWLASRIEIVSADIGHRLAARLNHGDQTAASAVPRVQSPAEGARGKLAWVCMASSKGPGRS